MLGHFQQIHDAREARSPRQFRRDIRKRDLQNLLHDDVAGRKRIAAADLHVRSLPEANGARDLALPNTISQRRQELHATAPPKLIRESG